MPCIQVLAHCQVRELKDILATAFATETIVVLSLDVQILVGQFDQRFDFDMLVGYQFERRAVVFIVNSDNEPASV